MATGGAVVAYPLDDRYLAALGGWVGLAFWTALTAAATSFPVQTPRRSTVSVFIAPVLASTFLGGPVAGALVSLVGTLELRELRGEVPWYGTLYNHASAVFAAVVAGFAYNAVTPAIPPSSLATLVSALLAGVIYAVVSEALAALAVAVRQGRSFREVLVGDLRAYGLSLLGLVPLAWLMALAFENVGYVVALLFALPLYTTRAAYASVVEIRRMFVQTIKALASAIDARDPSTKKHSEHVSTIAVEIGEELGLGEADLEKLQWGGLLHDVGKIGIPDAVLLKPSRLNREERMQMNAHPEKGRDILRDVDALQPILPVILHHHQWFNGSGYPKVPVDGTDRALVGEEIPLLARILHVADAFEAMTAVRPYRLNPLTPAQAMAELRKYSGVQFDPGIVDAFARTETGRGLWPRPEPQAPEAAAEVPLIGEVARDRVAATRAQAAAADGSAPGSAPAPAAASGPAPDASRAAPAPEPPAAASGGGTPG